jgi:dTMP kinase
MTANLKKGIFISLEGIEGTGKTTQARLLAERLMKEGREVVLTKEPGGTVIGNGIRDVLLNVDHRRMSEITELLLYNADRAQHLNELVIPSLNAGKVVITDRFTDSTIAYQGYGRGIDIELLKSIDYIATCGFMPDITLLFDLDVETGLIRNRNINKVDRLELEDVEFHKKVRDGFFKIAFAESERVVVIDASLSVEAVAEKVWEIWLLKTS